MKATKQLASVQEHIEKICKEAGLGVMVQVLEIVHNRGTVGDRALLDLRSSDVTMLYEGFIGPAIDNVEDDL